MNCILCGSRKADSIFIFAFILINLFVDNFVADLIAKRKELEDKIKNIGEEIEAWRIVESSDSRGSTLSEDNRMKIDKLKEEQDRLVLELDDCNKQIVELKKRQTGNIEVKRQPLTA